MTRRFPVSIATLLLFLALSACGEKAPPAKRYPMRGEIRALDPSTKTAMIAGEKIDDWMGAMTMEYPVKPDAEFQKLHVGDRIEATVVVQDVKYYVTDVKVSAP